MSGEGRRREGRAGGTGTARAATLTISAARTGPRTRRRRSACRGRTCETPRDAVRTGRVPEPAHPSPSPPGTPEEPAPGRMAYLVPPRRVREQKGSAASPGSTIGGRGGASASPSGSRRACASPLAALQHFRFRRAVGGGARSVGRRGGGPGPVGGGREAPRARAPGPARSPGGARPRPAPCSPPAKAAAARVAEAVPAALAGSRPQRAATQGSHPLLRVGEGGRRAEGQPRGRAVPWVFVAVSELRPCGGNGPGGESRRRTHGRVGDDRSRRWRAKPHAREAGSGRACVRGLTGAGTRGLTGKELG